MSRAKSKAALERMKFLAEGGDDGLPSTIEVRERGDDVTERVQGSERVVTPDFHLGPPRGGLNRSSDAHEPPDSQNTIISTPTGSNYDPEYVLSRRRVELQDEARRKREDARAREATLAREGRIEQLKRIIATVDYYGEHNAYSLEQHTIMSARFYKGDLAFRDWCEFLRDSDEYRRICAEAALERMKAEADRAEAAEAVKDAAGLNHEK